jgi:hypothetical protein
MMRLITMETASTNPKSRLYSVESLKSRISFTLGCCVIVSPNCNSGEAYLMTFSNYSNSIFEIPNTWPF